ncbi:kinase-like domain-containing protein [Penicillium verhagenii]|nr:kinase-like domain-containing protein [Penicillium verhagenii]
MADILLVTGRMSHRFRRIHVTNTLRAYEASNLQFIAAKTTSLVPRVHGVQYEDRKITAYTMNFIPGKRLDKAWNTLTLNQKLQAGHLSLLDTIARLSSRTLTLLLATSSLMNIDGPRLFLTGYGPEGTHHIGNSDVTRHMGARYRYLIDRITLYASFHSYARKNTLPCLGYRDFVAAKMLLTNLHRGIGLC